MSVQTLDHVPTVVACVDVSDVRDGQEVAEAATARAGTDGARLVFYVVDGNSAFSSVRPTRWSADGDRYGDLLDPLQLELLGEHHVAVAVHRARQAGVDAYGWLPLRRGIAGIGRYARENAAGVVVLAAAHAALAASLRDWGRENDLEVVTA
ncbi:MAG: hypothetical protein QOE45_297 [Frankiaceae bacterium]|jgi:hypothetical protein|nr:hypothetical protein [Frankiaceae bacterium]